MRDRRWPGCVSSPGLPSLTQLSKTPLTPLYPTRGMEKGGKSVLDTWNALKTTGASPDFSITRCRGNEHFQLRGRTGARAANQDGSHETDHLLGKRLTLITPARAAEDLSINASRTCNSQIPLKRPPQAFLSMSTHNKCNLCLSITIFISLKKIPE